MDETTARKLPVLGRERSILDTTSIDWAIKIACLAILAYWSLLLVQPFLTIIVWSIILAVALYPIFDWMVTRLRLYRAAAAALITILSFAIVLGPATWLGVSLIATVGFFVDQLNSGAIAIPPPPQAIKDLAVHRRSDL